MLHVKADVVVMQCSDKPSDPDKYGFSNFARMLMSGKGVNPLPSDSRRRPDRAALQVCSTFFFQALLPSLFWGATTPQQHLYVCKGSVADF